MKTKEFKGIISQNAVRDNSLILNIIEYSCIPFNSWFETHSRLKNYRNKVSHTPIDFIFIIWQCNHDDFVMKLGKVA